MKTIKILTIGTLMLVSATVFTQDSVKREDPKPNTSLVACRNESKPVDEQIIEARESYYRLKDLMIKQEEEIRYDPNEFVEKESQEELNN